MTTNAPGPEPGRGRARRGRAAPGQRQPRHRPPRARSTRSPGATGSTTSIDGLAAAGAAGLGPVKVNAVLLRGVNDDQARGAAAVVPRPRLRAAVHRADAAGRPARLDPRRDDHRRRDLRAPRAGVRAQPRRGAAGERAGREVPGRRRTGDGRRDRLGDPAVLRRLRPGPADRRRPGAQLPVRPRRSPTCGGAARAERATRSSPSAGGSRCAARRPATGSTTRRSCSPTGRCQRSAAESGHCLFARAARRP